MIIYGFGDDINQLTNTLTGDHPKIINQSDKSTPARQVLNTALAGAGGAYKLYSGNYFPGALTVETSGEFIDTNCDTAGQNATILKDNLARVVGPSRLWLIEQDEYIPKGIIPTSGLQTVSLRLFRSGGRVSGRMLIKNLDGTLATAAYVPNAGSTSVYLQNGSYLVDGRYYFPDVTTLSADYGDLYYVDNNTLLTVSGATSFDLDMVLNKTYWPFRWTYADLITANLTPDGNFRRRVGFSATFQVNDGLWRGIRRRALKDESTAATFDLTMSGTINAPLHIELTANVNPITAFTITNNTDGNTITWTGTLAATKKLIIDVETYTITNDGADAWSALTPGAGQIAWSYIAPSTGGTNSFTVSVTQTTADNWDLTLDYYDMYDQ